MKTVIVVLLFGINLNVIVAEYYMNKTNLIEHEKSEEIGGNITLTPNEIQVNNILMYHKLKEFDAGFASPDLYLPHQHFFKSKNKIEKSAIYKFIRKLPKGASLHSHNEAQVSEEFLYNLTFKENLYGCTNGSDLSLRFFEKDKTDNSCRWQLVSESRKNDPNFNRFLSSKLTLYRTNPDEVYLNINSIWAVFEKIFSAVTGLIMYKPVYEEYFYQALKELYEDNVKYAEIRISTPYLYDIDGKTYSDMEAMKVYIDVIKKFQKDYPDFMGCKFIYTVHRKLDKNKMVENAKSYMRLKRAFPDYFVGFDLVGQEDLGHPLDHHIPIILELKRFGANFYFHAGETNWHGQPSDLNLFDAILLNATRIGHGYALLKHPAAAKLVKERHIGIEICPISSQVLMLVSDLRNHPGSIMIANGFPVVIANDDPSFWGAKGLSFDWYLAYMGMTSRTSDLRVLKQLAINSIEYSSLGPEEKNVVMSQWEKDWDIFIKNMLHEYY